MVSFGGFVYLASDVKFVGALIFTLGLFTICEFGFCLFTGRVGYALFKGISYITDLLVILLGNLTGCLIMGNLTAFVKPGLVEVAQTLCTVKISESLFQNFVLSFFCGIMMFVAVEFHKTKESPAKFLGMFLAVPLFIICGFEHSIANMFYFTLAGTPTLTILYCITVTVLGNAAGSIVFSLYKFLGKNVKKS